jgi:hypothetical protein
MVAGEEAMVVRHFFWLALALTGCAEKDGGGASRSEG